MGKFHKRFETVLDKLYKYNKHMYISALGTSQALHVKIF